LKQNPKTSSRKRFALILWFSFFVYSIFVIIIFYIFSNWLIEKKELEQFKNQSQIQANSKERYLQLYLDNLSRSLKSIAFNPYFMSYVVDKNYMNSAEFLFLTIMLEHNDYMQLRYIGVDGKELLRFDRDNPQGYPYKKANLQNKSDRYYFKEASKLSEGEIYTSKIDYNVENGKIVQPFVPVFRVSIPIYLKGELKGVLTINTFANEIIKLFASSASFDMAIFGDDKSLIYMDGRFYDRQINEKLITDILHIDNINLPSRGEHLLSYEKKMFIQPINMGTEMIYVAILPKKDALLSLQTEDYQIVSLLILLLLFLAFPLSYLLSRPIESIFEQVMRQQDELAELTQTLENRVQEKTEENIKKDRLLIHQARLAELGEMIGNIAHQWRHPLTRLSLILQNINALNKKEKLTITKANQMISKANEQIFFMSDTIDNFKDFYRQDESREYFEVYRAYTQIVDMVGHNLKHSNIYISYQGDTTIKIYGNQNEFSQVLLNLIINARDALVANSTDDAYIEVSVLTKDSNTIIKVKDNAGGVSKDIVEKIFEPYFSTKQTHGIGIGLYMVKNIIKEKFDGSVKIYNDNSGAVFLLEIPKR